MVKTPSKVQNAIQDSPQLHFLMSRVHSGTLVGELIGHFVAMDSLVRLDPFPLHIHRGSQCVQLLPVFNVLHFIVGLKHKIWIFFSQDARSA